MPTTPANDDSSDALLPERVRTLVSFLLFVHLFALAASIGSNIGPFVSGLRRGLGDVPLVRPYVQLLNMDNGYDFHLTYGAEEDGHLTAVIGPGGAETQPDRPTWQFPGDDVSPPIRRQRYRMLLLTAHRLAQQELAESELPKAIAQFVLRQHGIDDGQFEFQLLRQNLPIPEIPGESVTTYQPPPGQTPDAAYTARLWFAPNGLQISKSSSAFETARVKTSDTSREQ